MKAAGKSRKDGLGIGRREEKGEEVGEMDDGWGKIARCCAYTPRHDIYMDRYWN